MKLLCGCVCVCVCVMDSDIYDSPLLPLGGWGRIYISEPVHLCLPSSLENQYYNRREKKRKEENKQNLITLTTKD